MICPSITARRLESCSKQREGLVPCFKERLTFIGSTWTHWLCKMPLESNGWKVVRRHPRFFLQNNQYVIER